MAAAALVFFVPSFFVEPGGIASGWADAPLATAYLAAVVYLLDYALNGTPGSLRLSGLCAATLPWIKQEGAVLWVCVSAVAFALAWRRRESKAVLLAAGPGLVVILVWRVFLAWAKTPHSEDFLPVHAATFFKNIPRLEIVAKVLLGQVFVMRRWSVLWIAALVAFVQLGRANRIPGLLLATCVLLPVALYSAVYTLSAWPDVRMHVVTSLPRLLIHVAPVAVLAIALALPPRQ